MSNPCLYGWILIFGEPSTQYIAIYNVDYCKVTSSQNVWIALWLAYKALRLA